MQGPQTPVGTAPHGCPSRASLGQSPTRPPLSPWPGLPRDTELQCLSQSPLLSAHYVALS